MTDVVHPVMDVVAETPTWPGATWVGHVTDDDLRGAELALAGGEGFRRARLLVWSHDQPWGFIEVPVVGGAVDIGIARAETAKLPNVALRPARWPQPPITVVVCTRDRPEQLEGVLADARRIDYPHFEVLVVDNNPASGLTRPVVESFSDDSIRIVDAVGQGLSIARNVGINNARYDIVAFTDDDVVIDPYWLTNLAYGFARNERTACVCGMVPSAELITPAQSYFDRRVGWARRIEHEIYDLAAPPADDPLFPMRVGQYGTGANFAVRRDALIQLGGFDEGLGIGSPSGGGEDIDIFVRFLLAGHVLVREPSAVVWHRHRRTPAELEVQVFNYGLGLGAWIAKLASRPRTFRMALRRVVPAIRHLRHVTVVEQEQNGPADPEVDALYGRELKGVIRGPIALMSARLVGRKAAPLSARSSSVMRAFDFRRGQNWGDPGNSVLAGRLSIAAVVLGLIGMLGAVPSLPQFVLAAAVGGFVLGGPGSMALSWYASLPTAVVLPLIPPVSIAICLIAVSGLLMLGFYSPVIILVGLASVTIIGALARCRSLALRQPVGAR